MSRRQLRTLEDIFNAGFDLRVWCFGCARGVRIDSIWFEHFKERGWPIELPAAHGYFRCRCCGSTDHVLVLPATPPPRPPARPSSAVEYWFHNRRKGRLLL